MKGIPRAIQWRGSSPPLACPLGLKSALRSGVPRLNGIRGLCEQAVGRSRVSASAIMRRSWHTSGSRLGVAGIGDGTANVLMGVVVGRLVMGMLSSLFLLVGVY